MAGNPQQAFFKKHEKEILEASRLSGALPSVIAAQMALESAYGKSAPGNNLFGVKALANYSGAKQESSTLEFENGRYVRKMQPFKVYQNQQESIRDYSAVIKGKRYEKALQAKTPEEQIDLIHKAGYATDKLYPQKIMNIINSYGLKDLDKRRDAPFVAPEIPAKADKTVMVPGTSAKSPLHESTVSSLFKPIPQSESNGSTMRSAAEGLPRDASILMDVYNNPDILSDVGSLASKLFKPTMKLGGKNDNPDDPEDKEADEDTIEEGYAPKGSFFDINKRAMDQQAFDDETDTTSWPAIGDDTPGNQEGSFSKKSTMSILKVIRTLPKMANGGKNNAIRLLSNK